MTCDPQQQDAEHLRLLSIFHYVVAAMMALWGSFPIIHFVVGLAMLSGAFEPPKQGGPPLEFVGALFTFVGGLFITVGWTMAICTFFAGRNLARRQHYMYCLVMAGIMAAACMPLGTVLGVFTIIVLLRPSVKEAFGVASPMGGPSAKPIPPWPHGRRHVISSVRATPRCQIGRDLLQSTVLHRSAIFIGQASGSSRAPALICAPA